MPDIKTRVATEKAVKTLDKSAIAAQRMKSAHVQAKEKAERSAPVDQDSPESYAADRVSDEANTAIFEGVHQLDRQGRRGVKVTKENLAKLKARFQRKRLTDPLKKKPGRGAAGPDGPSVEVNSNIRRNPGTQRAANPVRRPAGAGRAVHGEQAPIKTVERTGKTVKQSARSTGQAVAKTAGRTVKSARNSVKTAEAAGRTAAKTAKASQRMAQTAAARAKKAAKTSMAAVRAIITGTRALIAAIAAGGWVAMVMLVVICLIGLLVSSPSGFSFPGRTAAQEKPCLPWCGKSTRTTRTSWGKSELATLTMHWNCPVLVLSGLTCWLSMRSRPPLTRMLRKRSPRWTIARKTNSKKYFGR